MPSIHATASALAQPQRKELRILLVEDQAELRNLLEDYLNDIGVEVRTAVNVDEAMDVLREFPCDVLFSDVHMPGQSNGIELANHVNDVRPEARVILASGHPRTQLGSFPAGAEFLQKPFRLSQFMALIS